MSTPSAFASKNQSPNLAETRAGTLRIGGLVRLSSVDWPGELAATVFLQGCPWRCPYCHNQHLLEARPGAGSTLIPWSDVREFLTGRVGLLDAVVFSGGEPLAQASLSDAVAEASDLGFKVALHTGGASPGRFAEILPILSWVGFDVKAPFADYARVTGATDSGEQALESLRALARSEVPFEVRTTVDPGLLGPDDLARMAAELDREGVAHWVIQPVRHQTGARSEAFGATSTQNFVCLSDRARFASFEIRT